VLWHVITVGELLLEDRELVKWSAGWLIIKHLRTLITSSVKEGVLNKQLICRLSMLFLLPCSHCAFG
jgi:hypothetical protein